MSKSLPLMPGVTIENETDQRLYVRGRQIQTQQGPIKIFIVAQDPGAFSVNGYGDDYELGVPAWLKSVAGTALNIASAAGIPGAGAIKSVAEATGILKSAKAAPKAAARAAVKRAPQLRAALARQIAVRPAAPKSAVRHLPKGAKVPKKYVEVIPVALATEGAGFLD